MTPCLFQIRCAHANTVVKAPKGTTIVMAEQRVSFVYHLHEGVVGYYSVSPSGQDIVSFASVAPYFIGLAGFAGMDAERRIYHFAEARAITPVVYCKTRREAVWDLMDDRQARASIMDMICGTAMHWSESSPLESDVASRVIMILDALVRSVGTPDARGGVVIHEVTHGDVAAMANVTRPTVTRTLERLQRQGVLATGRRQIAVARPSALRRNPWS